MPFVIPLMKQSVGKEMAIIVSPLTELQEDQVSRFISWESTHRDP